MLGNHVYVLRCNYVIVCLWNLSLRISMYHANCWKIIVQLAVYIFYLIEYTDRYIWFGNAADVLNLLILSAFFILTWQERKIYTNNTKQNFFKTAALLEAAKLKLRLISLVMLCLMSLIISHINRSIVSYFSL